MFGITARFGVKPGFSVSSKMGDAVTASVVMGALLIKDDKVIYTAAHFLGFFFHFFE
jgi:hypothetical protein